MFGDRSSTPLNAYEKYLLGLVLIIFEIEMNKQLLTEFEPIAAIATTPKGVAILNNLCVENKITLGQPGEGDLKTHITKLWQDRC